MQRYAVFLKLANVLPFFFKQNCFFPFFVVFSTVGGQFLPFYGLSNYMRVYMASDADLPTRNLQVVLRRKCGELGVGFGLIPERG